MAERADTVARLAALTRDVDGIVASRASVSVDDEHDPEGATLAYERAHASALAAQAQLRLDELDEALARLASGAYGRCERCGEPIPVERLRARPAARTCVGCATGRR
jgi:RNA polymerase-binding transcription factor DksA